MARKQITYSRHVFITLTYSRDVQIQESWKKVSKDYNRFIQRLRLKPYNTSYNYIRVIEQHRDGYPHIHCIIQHPTRAVFRITFDRYVDRVLRKSWKARWPHGFSDVRAIKTAGRTGSFFYLLKYLSKNQTKKTIYKKVIIYPAGSTCGRGISVKKEKTPLSTENHVLPTHLNGVKLCTWSRNFDFTPFQIIKSS